MNQAINIYTLKKIETSRLIIRPVQLGDEVEINQVINRSLKSLQRWMPWAKDPSLDATREFIQYSVWCWTARKSNLYPMAIINRVDQKIIAVSGFNDRSVPVKPFYELGYWIDVQYQGQGLVTELVNALTRYALDALQAHRVQICTHIDNEKSIAVAKRCGFEHEAIRKNDRVDCESGQLADGLIFACCDTNLLPPLDVTWEHKDGNDESDISSIKPTEHTKPKHKITLPSLETKRLKLIPPREQDTQPFFDALMASIQEVGLWFSWANKNTILEQHHRHIQDGVHAATDIYSNDHLFFFVWDLKQEQLFGEVWYTILDWTLPYITISYWFDSRYTGHGYATEAVAELVKYAFINLKAKRVEVEISEQNIKSINLVKRLGFIFEGKLRNYFRNFITNEVVAGELFAMTDISQLLEVRIGS